MAEKLRIEIGLDGGREVQQQLDQIGQAGEDSFKQIETAADQVDFQKLTDASKEVSDAINKIGDDANFQQLIEAINNLGTTLNKVSDEFKQASESSQQFANANQQVKEKSSETTTELIRTGAAVASLGGKVVETVSQHELLLGALGLYVGRGAAARIAFSALTAVLATTAGRLTLIGTAIFVAAKSIEAIGGSIAGSIDNWNKLSNTLGTLSENTGIAFDQLQRGKDAFDLLGVSAESFNSAMVKVGETLRTLDVGKELAGSAKQFQDAVRASLDAEKSLLEIQVEQGKAANESAAKLRIAQIEAIQDVLKLRDAQQKAAEAQDKIAEAAANNLGKVADQIHGIIDAQRGVSVVFDPLVKSETILKAFNIVLKETADAGGKASDAILQFIARADKLQALQVGKAFGLTDADVERIRLLNGTLSSTDEILKRLSAAGVAISPSLSASAKDLQIAVAQVEQSWVRLEKAWESSIFVETANRITARLKGLESDFINFAARVLEELTFENLSNRFQQGLDALKAIWFSVWEDIARGVAAIIEKIPGLSGAADALRQEADVLHKIVEDAANDFADIQEKIANSADNSNKLIARIRPDTGLDVAAEAAERFRKKLEEVDKKIQESRDNIAKIQGNAFEKLSQNAEQAADSIKKIEDRLADLQRSITQQGLQKGIIDPMTGGPVAGMEEAFDALQQQRFRANRQAQEQEDEVRRREAERADEIKRQLAEQLQKETEKLATLQKQHEVLTGQTEAVNALSEAIKQQTEALKQQTEELQKQSELQKQQTIELPEVKVGADSPFKQFTDAAQKAIDDIKQLFSGLGESLTSAIQGIDFNAVFQPLLDAAKEAFDLITRSFAEPFDTSGLISSIQQVIDKFLEMILAANKATEAAQAAVDATSGSTLFGGGEGGSAERAAQGGLLRGRPGIDTNLAWFTAGEFVMRRDAVQKWGVAFMQAINAGINPLGSTPRFAAGGLVSSAMSNVTIQFPGLPLISGLKASTDTVNELKRAAAMAQVRSGGRKPTRYS